MGGHLLQRPGRTGLGGTGSPAQGVFGVSCQPYGGPPSSENRAHRPGGDGESSPGDVRSLLPGQWGAYIFGEPGAPAWGGRGVLPRGCSESPARPMGGHLLPPPRPVRPVLRRRWPPVGLAGDSEHPLGWTPRPPQAGAPGSLKKMAPHWLGRRLRTPPRQNSPSPPGRCARFSEDIGPPLAWQEAPNTPWAGLPVPPGPVRPVLQRRWPPIGLAGDSEHPLGWTPRPPQAGAPGSLKKVAPRRPGTRLRTPPRQDSPSPPGWCARFSEEDGPPLAWQEAPNTPWAGLPVPPRPVRPVL